MKLNTNPIKEANRAELFQINSRPYGKSYVKWTEEWWQWVFSIPKNDNPVVDTSGKNCGKGQDGPVWYLAGTTESKCHVQRSCIVPRLKSILFPIIVSQFSRSEKPTMTVHELIRYTSKDIDETRFLEVIIDDYPLIDLPRYRVKSYFKLDMVKDNIWGIQPGSTMAASDGFWVFLKPLREGKHTICFHGVEPNFVTRATYYINIV